MTIRYLRIFAEVCKHQSVTRAAEALEIAQPTVSAAISQLEKYYGIQLFARINQRLTLTQSGRLLYEQALRVLNEFDNFEKLAQGEHAAKKLSIGSSLTIGQYILPKIIKKAKKLYPDLEITSQINQAKTIENMVLHGDLDFALIETAPTSYSLYAEPFSKDRMVAAAGTGYKVENNTITPQNIGQYAFILREKGSAARDFVDDYLAEHKLSITPVAEAVNTPVIISFLTNNLGISVLPYSLVSEQIASGILKEINFLNARLERTYNLIMLKNKQLTKEQAAVRELCFRPL